MSNIDIKKFAKEGFITNNPILIQVLGTCPTLATSTSVVNGVGMGLSTGAVLMFSNLLISALRKFIPKQIRIASYIVLISGFVTILEMLLKAYIPALDKSLGLFIPLIVVNCIILARAEAFAGKNDPLSSVLDGVFMGLGFTFALFMLGSIREIFGAGTFAGIKLFPEDYALKIIVSPPGAFISLGLLIAGFKAVVNFIESKNKPAQLSAGDEQIPDRLSTVTPFQKGAFVGDDATVVPQETTQTNNNDEQTEPANRQASNEEAN